ncbi:MAG: glycosyltransferase [Limisphaerales bacterium]
MVIADNGSTDSTEERAKELAQQFEQVRVAHLPEMGRGRALKEVWSESQADVLSYMDVDLSTDLSALPQLITAVTDGGFDLAVGSRLLPGSVVRRSWKRECISRCYNRLVKLVFHTRFSDAQCGFKAITNKAALELLPLVEDGNWFFDTELLVLAEKLEYRLCDVPVKWTDDADSRVRIVRTALEDLSGLIRLRRALKRRKHENKLVRKRASQRA